MAVCLEAGPKSSVSVGATGRVGATGEKKAARLSHRLWIIFGLGPTAAVSRGHEGDRGGVS